MTEVVGKIKLSKLQKKVMKDLQAGYSIITNCDVRGAWIGNKTMEYHINNRVFYNLVDKGFIYQSFRDDFHYVLTDYGKNIAL